MAATSERTVPMLGQYTLEEPGRSITPDPAPCATHTETETGSVYSSDLSRLADRGMCVDDTGDYTGFDAEDDNISFISFGSSQNREPPRSITPEPAPIHYSPHWQRWPDREEILESARMQMTYEDEVDNNTSWQVPDCSHGKGLLLTNPYLGVKLDLENIGRSLDNVCYRTPIKTLPFASLTSVNNKGTPEQSPIFHK